MLKRLEDAFHREKQFTADASHELRTPLSVVQGEATLALTKDRNVDEYRKSIENIYQEAERMSSVLKKLLFLARHEDNKQLEFETINVEVLLDELISDIEILCEDKSIRCKLRVMDDLFVWGDRVSLRELFFNLIDNAVRYTPQGGEILVSLSKEDGDACVAVKDNGTGIPEEHLKHIFKRFYRVDKYRSRSESGSGLGLSICQRIAEIHGGTIKVESQVGKGSTFTVFLPLVGSSS
jgi:signal transduction histidine kinase